MIYLLSQFCYKGYNYFPYKKKQCPGLKNLTNNKLLYNVRIVGKYILFNA